MVRESNTSKGMVWSFVIMWIVGFAWHVAQCEFIERVRVLPRQVSHDEIGPKNLIDDLVRYHTRNGYLVRAHYPVTEGSQCGLDHEFQQHIGVVTRRGLGLTNRANHETDLLRFRILFRHSAHLVVLLNGILLDLKAPRPGGSVSVHLGGIG